MNYDKISQEDFIESKLGALAQLVRQTRNKRNLTINDTAERCNVNRSTISEIENVNGNVRVQTILAVCHGLDLSPAELFGGYRPVNQISTSEMEIVLAVRRVYGNGNG